MAMRLEDPGREGSAKTKSKRVQADAQRREEKQEDEHTTQNHARTRPFKMIKAFS